MQTAEKTSLSTQPIDFLGIKISPMYLNLSGIVFLFWFASAAGSYLTVFLQESGYNTTQVGIITSISFAVAIGAMPFWGVISDRLHSIRKVFIICMAIASVLWALVPISADISIGSIFLISIIVPVSAFFKNPAMSLIDGFVVQAAANSKESYGNIRLWGSISYALMSFILAMVLPHIGIEVTFYLYGAMFLPLLIMLSRLGDINYKESELDKKEHKRQKLKDLQLGRLFKNYYFITYLIFVIAFYFPANASLTFIPYLVQEVGGDLAQLGLVVGYKALLEIPMLLCVRKLRTKFSLPIIILFAAALYIVEYMSYLQVQTFGQIIAVQTLDGLAAGLTIGISTNYVFALAPDELNGTAQTVNGATGTLAAILGCLFGGMIISALGIRNFYLICAVIVAVATAYFSLTLFLGKKVLKIPINNRALPSKK